MPGSAQLPADAVRVPEDVRRVDVGAGLSRAAALLEGNTFVVLALCAAGILQASFARIAIGPDSWYALIGGRLVSSSWLPHREAITVLAQGREWVDQQWLAHLALYGIWAAGGWPLALLALVVLFVGAFALSATVARLGGASERSVALVAFPCFLLGMTNTGFRAQTLTYVLFASVLMLLMDDTRRRSRRVLLVFPLLALWANMHGSVVLGAGLVSLYALTSGAGCLRRREPPGRWLARTSTLLVLPWACTLVSPYGLALPGHSRRVLENPALGRLVTEWQPVTVKSSPYFFAVLLGALWLVFRQRRAVTPFAQLALLASAAGGLLALRNVVWFALVAAAVVPAAVDDAWRPRPAPRRPRLNVAMVAAAVLALAAVAGAMVAHGRSWYERDYPRAAGDAVTAAVKADPSLRVFADALYADWLLYEHPVLQGRVAYDVRYELLTGGEMHGIYDFVNQRGENWSGLARGYRLLVLDPTREQKVISYYARRSGTRVLFRDTHAVVLELAAPRSA